MPKNIRKERAPNVIPSPIARRVVLADCSGGARLGSPSNGFTPVGGTCVTFPGAAPGAVALLASCVMLVRKCESQIS